MKILLVKKLIFVPLSKFWNIFLIKKFLNHVKENVLKNKGYICIELPSALSSEFSNPGHVFTYIKIINIF